MPTMRPCLKTKKSKRYYGPRTREGTAEANEYKAAWIYITRSCLTADPEFYHLFFPSILLPDSLARVLHIGHSAGFHITVWFTAPLSPTPRRLFRESTAWGLSECPTQTD